MNYFVLFALLATLVLAQDWQPVVPDLASKCQFKLHHTDFYCYSPQYGDYFEDRDCVWWSPLNFLGYYPDDPENRWENAIKSSMFGGESCPYNPTPYGLQQCERERCTEGVCGLMEFRYKPYVQLPRNNFTDPFSWKAYGYNFDGFPAFEVFCSITIVNAVPVIFDNTQASVHWKNTLKFPLFDYTIDYDHQDKDLIFVSNVGTVSPTGCGVVSWNKTEKRLNFKPNNLLGDCYIPITVRDRWASAPPKNVKFTVTNTIPTVPAINKNLFVGSNHTIEPFSYATDADGDTLALLSLGDASPSGCGSFIWDMVAQKINVFPSQLGLCSFTYQVGDGLQFASNMIRLTFTSNSTDV